MANPIPLWDFPPDAREVLGSLKSQIEEGTEEIDTILRRVAESAQLLTGANGSAIAIRDGGEVLCRARSGGTAPPLGSRLDAKSGISGECLLTGLELCCNDTAADPRVDPEVCRALGLRAVAVLPIRGVDGIAGILEVFSIHEDAFTTEHMVSLKCLAGLVESACVPPSLAEGTMLAGHELPHAPEHVAEHDPSLDPPQPGPVESIEPASAVAVKNRRAQRMAGWAAAALLLIALVGFRTYRSFNSSAKPAESTQQESAQAAVPKSVSRAGPSGALSSAKPSPSLASREVGNKERETGAAQEPGLQKASEVIVLPPTNPPPSVKSSSKSASSPSTEAAGSSRQGGGGDPNSNRAAAPPPLPATGTPTQEALLLPGPTLPKLVIPMSQGISGGTLQHEVRPVYPVSALAHSLEGDVVVEATITKDGDVRNPKLLRGDPILGQAALLAVKQWHYQPYRLNGQPVEMQTDITVQFKAK